MEVESAGKKAKAINYNELTGEIKPGDEVFLNTTAVEIGLGSGGYHFVFANLSNFTLNLTGPGHLVKLRYTPLQVKVLGVEEEASPAHRFFQNPVLLEGTPVVACLLHSMVAPVAAAVKGRDQNLCVAYVMTSGGALPLALSNLVRRLRAAKLLDGTVTTGHAFGGELEAVNVYTGLLAAKEVLGAAVIIVAMGPGILGTGTPWGFSGTEQGEIINAAHVLKGEAIAVLRVSFADPRPRHYGVSHHSLTVLGKIALARAKVALPCLKDPRKEAFLEEQLQKAGIKEKHEVIKVPGERGIETLKQRGISVSTMGRSWEEDPAFFLAAGAAGELAAQIAQVNLKGERS